MRVLLLGSGGREHALAWRIAQSPRLEKLYIAPGNPGMAAIGECVSIASDAIDELVSWAINSRIDLVIPGPEAPLVAGIKDACEKAGIACAGPSRAASQLEGSKTFMKSVAEAAKIPSARWERFTEIEQALAFIRRRGAPLVIKADGLAAGKGVVVATTLDDAQAAARAMLCDNAFGQAGHTILIEEFLEGPEVSLFAFCANGEALLLGAARDHKRVGDGDNGPNTGGMGAITPPPHFDRIAQEHALDLTVRPMLREMSRRGTPFVGIIFAGLMLTQDGPKLIEYNVRLGDPEAQALMLQFETDLLTVFHDLAHDKLPQTQPYNSERCALSLVIASEGYPHHPKSGGRIRGIERAEAVPGVRVFQAGTQLIENKLVAAGGRVLTICATGDTLSEARARVYQAAAAIEWSEKMFRHDIGMFVDAPPF